MNILIVTSEYTPFAKTGGLADSVAAMAATCKKFGHDVRVVMPLYGVMLNKEYFFEPCLNSMGVTMGIGQQWCCVRLLTDTHDVPIYCIEYDAYYKRQGLYHDTYYNDYLDNPQRFGFLCKAALQLAIDIEFYPEVVQVNDWQAALTAVYLKTWYWNHFFLGKTASVITIHNISFQGVYPNSCYAWLGLRQEHFTSDIFEDFGRMNFLKGGIYFADAINTVSHTHAHEITAPYGGYGLAPYLSNKGELVRGILNGVDYTVWSPEHDNQIPCNYSVNDLSGKMICKRELQKQFFLKEDPDTALIGLVGRLTEHKGFSLLQTIIHKLLEELKVQFVILGKGDPDFEQFFGTLPAHYPGSIGSYIGFNDTLAHLIEAGSDFFLMPSLFEPCGLNQMYSLRYGTLPIVHATGGLNDTVQNYDEKTGSGTGFKFFDPTPKALFNTIGWAVSTYYDRPEHMQQLIQSAMQQDFSWDKSAGQYIDLFHKAIEAKATYDDSRRL